jgi:hypothetical protein
MRPLRPTLLVLIALLASTAAAQRPSATADARLPVYLDCRATCDFDFLRQEIAYVDWVRDRAVADVHLLVTSQSTGAGGAEYTIAFLGQRAMLGRGDTLTLATNPTTTADEQRRLLAQTMAAGLAPFVARRGDASRLRITLAGADDEEDERARAAAHGRDPWRAWVFELGVGAATNGDANYRSKNLDGSLEATRVTEAWKVEVEADVEYQDDRFSDVELDSAGNVVAEEVFTSLRRSWEVQGLLVRSLGARLSAGLRGALRSDSYRNLRQAITGGPAIEYDVFPYAEATRRELTLQYGVGYELNRYVDTTIFDRTRDVLPTQYVRASYVTRSPWGSVELRADHRNYLTEAAKRRTELGGDASVRLFRGFRVNVYGEYNWIRDQISLRRGSGDQADVLLRRRELLSGHEYELGLGLSYTFGSIFNNVVNPRF